MSYDPTDFGSSDEHIPEDYEDYLDEIHVPLTEDELMELELFESDTQCLDIPDLDELDATLSELNFDE